MSSWIAVAAAGSVLIAAYLAHIGFRGHQYVIGIDLGTTYSVVAVKVNGTVQVIPNHETGKLLTPSVVSYLFEGDPVMIKENGQRHLVSRDPTDLRPYLVGDWAEKRRKTHPEATIYQAKRFIGRSVAEVMVEANTHPFFIGNPDFATVPYGKKQDDLFGKSPKNAVTVGKSKTLTREYNEFYQSQDGVLVNGMLRDNGKIPTKPQPGSKIRFDNKGVVITDEKDENFGGKETDVKPQAKAEDGLIDEASLLKDYERRYDSTGAMFYVEDPSLSRPELAGKKPKVSLFKYNHFWKTPTDIGSSIVRKLKDAAEHWLGYSVFTCVICVPAKFGSLQIEKTYEAFEKAGLKVARVMDEPTAAAVAYGLDKSATGKNIIVFDLGGGTLDASLLSISSKSVNVLGTSGDDHLGGSDFDHAMFQLLESKCLSQKNGQFEESRLIMLAEEVKIILSDATETRVDPCARGSENGITITRKDFEKSAKGLFQRVMMPVEQVLSDQMMTSDDVDNIVLVGGASRMPLVRQMLRDKFNKPGKPDKLNIDIDPDVTIAYGAANIDL